MTREEAAYAAWESYELMPLHAWIAYKIIGNHWDFRCQPARQQIRDGVLPGVYLDNTFLGAVSKGLVRIATKQEIDEMLALSAGADA